ncbi:MAG: manganese efflux pump MntP family protein [Bacillota bacterium]
MSLITTLLIALGLSMDAFTVSIANGMVMKKVKLVNALKIAVFFGGFQAIMPLIGWAVGTRFERYITGIDHWIAFILLGAIGIKMIHEAVKIGGECAITTSETQKDDPCNKTLTVMAIATSIDALAIGVSLAVLRAPITLPVIIIGLLTFAVCLAGVYIGRICGCMFKKYAEVFGGVVLIGIGLKILAEHTGVFEKIFSMYK